ESWQRLASNATSPSRKTERRSSAGKTAQYPSQYRQALQIVSCRLASSSSSGSPGMRRRLLSSYLAEDSADGQPDAAHVAVEQDVAGHHLAGRKDVLHRTAGAVENTGVSVHADRQIGERDARAHRVSEERRLLDGQRPVALRWLQTGGPAPVEPAEVEGDLTPGGSVELTHPCLQPPPLYVDLDRQLLDGGALEGWEERPGVKTPPPPL